MQRQDFETRSLRMERMLTVRIPAPSEDVERILAAVCRIVPLSLGAYDSNAFVTAPGIERYRPRTGAVAGEETDVRQRPGVVEVSFQMPDDQALLEQVLEAVYEAHSYQEQWIKVEEVLVSLTKGRDDRANPNRWWNTTGDWKTARGGA